MFSQIHTREEKHSLLKRHAWLLNDKETQHFYSKLQTSDPRKIITELVQYRAQAKVVNAKFNLLVAEYYLKVKNHEKVIETVQILFDHTYYDFDFHEIEFITDLILEIAKFHKLKARELLQIQLTKEMTSDITPRLSLVINIMRALQTIEGFDENAQKELLTYCSNFLVKSYFESKDNNRTRLLDILMTLVSTIPAELKPQLLEVLFKQYLLELLIVPLANKSNYQLPFDELVKSNFFDKVETAKLQLILDAIVRQQKNYNEHYKSSAPYSFVLLDQLLQLTGIIKNQNQLNLLDEALAQCRVYSPCYFAGVVDSVKQCKIMFRLELNSENPRFDLVQSLLAKLNENHNFDESLQHLFLLYYKRLLDKGFAKLPSNLEMQKNMIALFKYVNSDDKSLLLNLMYKLFSLEMNSEHGSFILFDEEIFAILTLEKYFNTMQDDDFAAFMNSIAHANFKQAASSEFEKIISRLEMLAKFMIPTRLAQMNKTLLDCYLYFHDSHVEKVIAATKEMKLEKKELCVLYRKLVDKVDECKPDIAIDLLLKCYIHDDIAALTDIAKIYEKDEKRVNDAIKYHRLAITESAKISNREVFISAVKQLLVFLTTFGEGLESAQKIEIKDIILSAFKSAFNDRKKNKTYDEFYFTVSKYLDKIKPLLDLSDVFDGLLDCFALEGDFLCLALEWFSTDQQRRKKYLDLYTELYRITDEMHSGYAKHFGAPGSDFLIFLVSLTNIANYFTDSKSNSHLNDVKVSLEKFFRDNHPFFGTESFKLFFSSDMDKLGFLGKLARITFEAVLIEKQCYSQLFEYYCHMYQSDSFNKNKDAIANNINNALTKAEAKAINMHVTRILELSVDSTFEQSAKAALRKCNDEIYSNVVAKKDKQHAKFFARTSHLPAIAFLINRKWFRTNAGYDYLCVVLAILLKENKNPQTHDVNKAYNKALDRIQHLSPTYRNIVKHAPENIKNIHMYLRQNITKQNVIYDEFLKGMRKALGFSKNEAGWQDWLMLLDRMLFKPGIVQHNPAPSAPEEKHEQNKMQSSTYIVSQLATEQSIIDDEPGATNTGTVLLPASSAPPEESMSDQDQPGMQTTNPHVLFQHQPAETSTVQPVKIEFIM